MTTPQGPVQTDPNHKPKADIFYCTTDTLAQAQALIDVLIAHGFHNKQMSLLIPDGEGNVHLPHEHEQNTRLSVLPDGVASGLIGGALGAYTGAISLFIPGLGVVLAAGPITLVIGGATLVGAAAGVVTGGLASFLMKVCMPEAEAKRHEQIVRQGKTLLIVHTTGHEELERAERVIIQSGIPAEISLSAMHSS